jgi:phosphoribosylamine-glycine ligase
MTVGTCITANSASTTVNWSLAEFTAGPWVVTGVGKSIAVAQRHANCLADRVLIPNVRYRRDIGTRLIDTHHARLEDLGLFDRA